MFRIGVILLVGLAGLLPHILLAQQADRPNDQVRVGDAWVYDNKDGITGLPINTFTSLVAEVSSSEIVTHLIYRGTNNRGFIVFDRDWNRLAFDNQTYNPNDGTGVRRPLEVGKEWRHEYIISNKQTGVNMKSAALTKVVAHETVTTPAGAFETFKVDRQTREFNTADPSRSSEIELLTWFAPQLNHWVRRTFIIKQERRTMSNTTQELVEIMRQR